MVEVEELTQPHYELVAKWLSEPDTNQWLRDWRGKKVDARIISVVAMSPRNKLFLVRYDAVECGLVALGAINKTNKTAEIWYLLGDRRYSGKSVITRAVKQVAKIAFNKLGMKSLIAQTMISNHASIRLLEKNNFREVGLLQDGSILEGEDAPRMGFELYCEDLVT